MLRLPCPVSHSAELLLVSIAAIFVTGGKAGFEHGCGTRTWLMQGVEILPPREQALRRSYPVRPDQLYRSYLVVRAVHLLEAGAWTAGDSILPTIREPHLGAQQLLPPLPLSG